MVNFSIGRLPRIEFGPGRIALLPGIAARYGQRLLILTGGRSFTDSPQWEALCDGLDAAGLWYAMERVTGEPSPDLVDDLVRKLHGSPFDLVVGIGGGSVMDAAKAVAGLLKPGNTVLDHLEGVGPELPYRGPATPFIAVPTTAGTGSEATKNAVLTRQGPDGFKKSFRDEALMAEYALIDPDLLAGCPPGLIAANGMDAFTQLLEAYVSSRSNPITDALAWRGLEAVQAGLVDWYQGGAAAASGRSAMALAALLSGICLAQAGLGSVHGLAQPLGSLFPIPHGVVCGTLLAAAARVNCEALAERDPAHPALAKYAAVGRLFGAPAGADDAAARDALLDRLTDLTASLALPPLSDLGVAEVDLPRIIANARGSSMKTNPVTLTDQEIERILRLRLSTE